jgi:O-antigen ligase
MVRDQFAHNDYLQYLIELGALGSLLVVAAGACIVFRAGRSAMRTDGDQRALAAACCGCFTAVLLHSAVDFSLQIPANGLLLAWVAGLACALRANSLHGFGVHRPVRDSAAARPVPA